MAKELKEVLVSVRNMEVTFGSKRNKFVAVHGVSFDIYKGETFGLVGESGSGKTTIGRAIIRINPTASGEIRYAGERIDGKISKKLDREITQKIQMIFQDPMASLNERAKVDYIVSEGLMNIHPEMSGEERASRVNKALLDVGLLPEFASRFPHEFSGGQRQRIGIARALATNPKFVVCDEAVSALDVSIQAQIINLLLDLKEHQNLTYMFITHDLSVVKYISDRVGVMYLGNMVELAEADEIFHHPIHPYTEALLNAIPTTDTVGAKELSILEGDIPSPVNPPKGCKFHTRCKYCTEICTQVVPAWEEVRPNHFVACHHKLEVKE